MVIMMIRNIQLYHKHTIITHLDNEMMTCCALRKYVDSDPSATTKKNL